MGVRNEIFYLYAASIGAIILDITPFFWVAFLALQAARVWRVHSLLGFGHSHLKRIAWAVVFSWKHKDLNHQTCTGQAIISVLDSKVEVIFVNRDL